MRACRGCGTRLARPPAASASTEPAPRARSRPRAAVDNDEVVATTGRGHASGPGPVRLARELVVASAEPDRERVRAWRPHAELDLLRRSRDRTQPLHRREA